MMIFTNMSLRYKLTGISMVACSIALMLAGAAFIAYDHQETKRNMASDLETLADVIGANCTVAIAFDNAQDATETLASLAAEEYISTAWVYRSDGTILANYASKGYQGNVVPESTPGRGPVFGTDYLDVFRNISIEGETVGAVYLRMDLKPLEDRLASIVTAVALVILATSLVVLMVVSRLQRVVSEPILSLTAIAKEISDSRDYSVRVPVSGRDEIGLLVEHFNGMLSQIQSRDSALQRAHDKLEDRVLDRTKKLASEVEEHEQSKLRISASLEEKEVLLKEIHHRVKNNLQIITSLLDLQARRIVESATRAMFQDSQTRVKSMALIHERLYRSNNLARVDLREYVSDLTRFLLSTFSGRNQRVEVENKVGKIELPVDQAVPCGLIVNELVCNCLKYAFPDEGRGVITISSNQFDPEYLELSVTDNGVGLPDDFDPTNSDTLGQKLVQSLVRQLGGSLSYERESGTKITIRFPIQDNEKQEEPALCLAQKC